MPSKPYGSGRAKGYEVSFRTVDPAGEVHRVRKRLRGVSKAAADAWERKVKDGIVGGTILAVRADDEPSAITFAQFVDDFLKTYPASADNKPSERAQKRSICKHHLVPFFGAMPLELTAENAPKDDKGKPLTWERMITRFKAAQLEGTGPAKTKLSRKTVNNELVVFNRIMAHALEEKQVTTRIHATLLKTGKQEAGFYEREQVKDLLEEARTEGAMWHAMVLFAASTGLRLGELEALEWRDVDLARRRVVVSRSIWKGVVGTPKSGHARAVPLSDEAIAALKSLQHARPRVFSRNDGGKMNASIALKAMYRIQARARLPKNGWHKLRHTFGTELARRGVAARTIQEWMGHQSIAMTNRYMHHAPDAQVRNPISFADESPEAAPNNVAKIRPTS